MPVLRLFAAAREAAGTARLEVEGSSVAEVLEHARQRFGPGFGAVLERSRVWVNGQPVTEGQEVREHDVVAVLPPVSGGAGSSARAPAPPPPPSPPPVWPTLGEVVVAPPDRPGPEDDPPAPASRLRWDDVPSAPPPAGRVPWDDPSAPGPDPGEDPAAAATGSAPEARPDPEEDPLAPAPAPAPRARERRGPGARQRRRRPDAAGVFDLDLEGPASEAEERPEGATDALAASPSISWSQDVPATAGPGRWPGTEVHQSVAEWYAARLGDLSGEHDLSWGPESDPGASPGPEEWRADPSSPEDDLWDEPGPEDEETDDGAGWGRAGRRPNRRRRSSRRRRRPPGEDEGWDPHDGPRGPVPSDPVPSDPVRVFVEDPDDAGARPGPGDDVPEPAEGGATEPGESGDARPGGGHGDDGAGFWEATPWVGGDDQPPRGPARSNASWAPTLVPPPPLAPIPTAIPTPIPTPIPTAIPTGRSESAPPATLLVRSPPLAAAAPTPRSVGGAVRGSLALVPPAANRVDHRPTPDLAVVPADARVHVPLGIAWAGVTVATLALGVGAVGLWLAACAAVAALQGTRRWHHRDEAPLPVVAAGLAGGLPLAAVAGLEATVVALGLAVMAALAIRALVPSATAIRDLALSFVLGLPVGLAAMSVVLLAGEQLRAAILLLALAAAYDLGAFLVGSGSSSWWEGPVAGVACIVPVTLFASVVLAPPFSTGSPLLLGLVAAVLAPLGPPAARAVVDGPPGTVPALARLDSLLVMAPVWAWAAIGFLR